MRGAAKSAQLFKEMSKKLVHKVSSISSAAAGFDNPKLQTKIDKDLRATMPELAVEHFERCRVASITKMWTIYLLGGQCHRRWCN
jgi:hypothetical protein